jgi:hypothetical protein
MKGYTVFCDEPFSSVKIKITEFCTVFNNYFIISGFYFPTQKSKISQHCHTVHTNHTK